MDGVAKLVGFAVFSVARGPILARALVAPCSSQVRAARDTNGNVNLHCKFNVAARVSLQKLKRSYEPAPMAGRASLLQAGGFGVVGPPSIP